MTDRRAFLHSLAAGAATLTLPTFRPSAIRSLAEANAIAGSRAAAAVAEDEAYWATIQLAFDLDRTMINLNNGGCSPAPTHVLEQMIRDLKFSNELPVDHMWNVLERHGNAFPPDSHAQLLDRLARLETKLPLDVPPELKGVRLDAKLTTVLRMRLVRDATLPTLLVASPGPAATPAAPSGTRWWLWGMIGAVVVGGAVTAVVLSTGGTTTIHDGSLGTLRR